MKTKETDDNSEENEIKELDVFNGDAAFKKAGPDDKLFKYDKKKGWVDVTPNRFKKGKTL